MIDFEHHRWVVREKGIRQWIAWQLVRIAYRVKDTTHYQVVVHGGLEIIITGDAWGCGLNSVHNTDDSSWYTGEFDTFEKACDWATYTAQTREEWAP